MIGEKMQKAINDQINAELCSAYLYLSMVSYFESANLPGFATWMRVQVQEEIAHAMKFFDYMLAQGRRALVQPIAGPETQWDSPLAVFEAAYRHEQYVTERIHNLMKIARKESDTATEILLQWFVTEQVEEESNADRVVQKLKRAGDTPAALFIMDQELGARVFVPPTKGGAAT
jgi:ferritin